MNHSNSAGTHFISSFDTAPARTIKSTALWWLTALLLIVSGASAASAASKGGRKYHPGHYISMQGSDGHTQMMQAIDAGVVGMQVRYRWRELEPQKGKYDFSQVKSDLDFLASQGMHLVVFIEDKTFNGKLPTPDYLRKQTLKNRNRGYTVERWSPVVVDRFKRLLQQLGRRFDDHPAFEGVAIQESAPSLDGKVLDAHGYTPQKYRDALIEILLTAAHSMPKSQVFWYMNFLPGHQDYIGDIAARVAPAGVAMGGPDILPDNRALRTRAYPFYDELNGRMTLFGSMQFSSYAHLHKGSRHDYWTMNELFRFARDQLHVSYIFWNRKAWRARNGSYNLRDALPIISNNAIFNR